MPGQGVTAPLTSRSGTLGLRPSRDKASVRRFADGIVILPTAAAQQAGIRDYMLARNSAIASSSASLNDSISEDFAAELARALVLKSSIVFRR